MQAIRAEILPNTFLTCVTTEKFKTGLLSVNLITQLDRENAAKNALLPKVLCLGGASHPDMASVQVALDELYGARITPIIRKKGELHCVGLIAGFADDDYVRPGENILERAAGLLGEFLLSPNTRGGLLLSEYVENEKSNLIDEIRAGVNDKRAYAVDRMLEHMCAGENFGANRRGTETAASAVTASALTRHYKELIGQSRLELFYCGAASAPRVSAAVTAAFSSLPRKSPVREPGTSVRLTPPSRTKRVTETLAVNQGKLTMGFRLGECMKHPDYAAILVFNAIFGGSVTSKLFLNVREKLSLCYYASSSAEKHKGILTVSSGVEPRNFEAAQTEILAQLDAVRRGDISAWELLSAKRAVITSIKAALDRPSGVEELYFDNAVAQLKLTPDELAALADTVTADDITAVAAGVKLDTVYTLTGNGGGANED